MVIDDYSTANAQLQQQLCTDRLSLHYSKDVPMAELWEDDRKVLLPLPEIGFQPVRSFQRTVNKYGEVTIGRETYHLPTAHHRQQVFIQSAWDCLKVYDVHGERLIAHLPRHYVFKAKDIDWKATLNIYANKPRAIEQASHLKALPNTLKRFLLADELSERRRRIGIVIALFEDHDLPTVTAIVEKGLAHDRTDLPHLRMFADLLTAADSQSPLQESWTPAGIVDWAPDLCAYNTLAPGGMHRE